MIDQFFHISKLTNFKVALAHIMEFFMDETPVEERAMSGE